MIVLIKKKSERKHELYPQDALVALFFYYIQKESTDYCVYKYKSIEKDKWSEERKVIIKNVPDGAFAATACYCALLDLKANVKTKVFFNGQQYKEDYRGAKTLRSQLPIFPEGSRLLKDNDITFEYCNIKAFKKPYIRDDLRTINELKSRCMQISNKYVDKSDVRVLDFRDFIAKE